MKKPKLNNTLFWDADPAMLDWKKNANAIIIRVLERGTLADFKEIRKYYGDKKIVMAATSARSLSKKTVNFISAIFKVSLIRFRCYKKKQFHELQWMY